MERSDYIEPGKSVRALCCGALNCYKLGNSKYNDFVIREDEKRQNSEREENRMHVMQGRSGDVGCIQLKKHFEVTVKLAFVMFSSYTLIICIIDITVTPNCRVSVAHGVSVA